MYFWELNTMVCPSRGKGSQFSNFCVRRRVKIESYRILKLKMKKKKFFIFFLEKIIFCCDFLKVWSIRMIFFDNVSLFEPSSMLWHLKNLVCLFSRAIMVTSRGLEGEIWCFSSFPQKSRSMCILWFWKIGLFCRNQSQNLTKNVFLDVFLRIE